MSKNNVYEAARRLHTHTVVFDPDSLDELCVVKAICGKTTKCIARETGLTTSQVQYRIIKAQRAVNAKFRSDFRNGNEMSKLAETAIRKPARAYVRTTVAVKFSGVADR